MDSDWLKLWRELVITTSHTRNSENDKLQKRYKAHDKKQSERPDPLLDFILKNIDSSISVLDVGAGTGRWTIPIAQAAKNVTAVEPSAAMRDMLDEKIKSARLTNVRIIEDRWEDAVIEPHDVIVCAHGMYSNPDFASFVKKVEQYTNNICYLAIRLPQAGGIIGELSQSIYGRFHDSPNAIVAFNALFDLGIYTNVLIEDDVYKWENKTYEDAFYRAKHHLRLESTDKYDRLIQQTLARRLVKRNNSLVWPDGMRSALLWWKPM